MFRSGFSESFLSGSANHSSESLDSQINLGGKPDSVSINNAYSSYDDSDEEEEDQLTVREDSDGDDSGEETSPASSLAEKPQFDSISNSAISFSDMGDMEHDDPDKPSAVNEQPKVSAPPTPPSEHAEPSTEATIDEKQAGVKVNENKLKTGGPRKTIVVVSDVAYATYRAVLYYVRISYACNAPTQLTVFLQLYTDNIVFAPLASSFHNTAGAAHPGSPTAESATPKMQSEEQSAAGGAILRASQSEFEPINVGPSTRRAWIADWERNNPGRIPPCSAKAVYRIADSEHLAHS